MQAFTAAVPAHAFDIAELTELTPTLDIAMAAHDTAEQASEASSSGLPCTSTIAGVFGC
jgi:hypothetical protein